MRNMGSVNQSRMASVIYDAVTTKSPGHKLQELADRDSNYPRSLPFVSIFKGKRLQFVDFRGVRFVEQNPNTQSAYASRARQGAVIVWMIRLIDNVFLGCIEDGTVHLHAAGERLWNAAVQKEQKV